MKIPIYKCPNCNKKMKDESYTKMEEFYHWEDEYYNRELADILKEQITSKIDDLEDEIVTLKQDKIDLEEMLY